MRLFRTDDRNYSGRDGAKLHRIPATGAIEVAVSATRQQGREDNDSETRNRNNKKKENKYTDI